MIRIINWSKYQSYKDRSPPWIRFHRSTLDDFKFQSMTAESRALLPMLWLLACEDKDPVSGLIRISNDEVTFRLRISTETLTDSLRELQASDFIECTDSGTDSYINSYETVSPETETETETDSCRFDEFYKIYPNKKGPSVAKKAYRKVIKSGVSHENIMSGLNSFLADIEKNKTEKRFIAHPSTWLNQGRYADEYDTAGPRIR